MRISNLAATVLLGVAMAALTGCATNPAPATAPARAKPAQTEAIQSEQAKSEADDDRKVCVLQKTLGSNHKERICRTAKQAREEREAARGQLDRVQSGRGN